MTAILINTSSQLETQFSHLIISHKIKSVPGEMLEDDGGEFFRIAILFHGRMQIILNNLCIITKKWPIFSPSNNSLCLEDEYFTCKNILET